MYLILGKNGQLARAFKERLGENAYQVGRPEIDLGDLSHFNPAGGPFECVINCSAYTNVAQAEKEEELATQVNGYALKQLAQYCLKAKIPLIHFSTDYVFDGSGESPWREDDLTGPLNAYGRSKLKGEAEVLNSGCHFLIFRVSWVYDDQGLNFLNTILQKAETQEELKIVDDQIGAPSFTGDIVDGVMKTYLKVQEKGPFQSGIFHLVPSGVTSWYGFASKIVEVIKENSSFPCAVESIKAVKTSDFPSSVVRPLNSRLSTNKLEKMGIKMPHWEQGLKACIEIKQKRNS